MIANLSTILIVLGLAVVFFGLALGALWVGLVMKKGGRRSCICGRSDLDESGSCDGRHDPTLVQINVNPDSPQKKE
ncbi:MAG: hypothetical protein GXY44_10795 [Phycisphaerales bacterium]|nr:hypothetical protein [Phycisphaerales bacterium]